MKLKSQKSKLKTKKSKRKTNPAKIGVWVFFALLIQTVAFAEVSIETAVSRSRVAVGEELTLDIIISDADGKISRPQISSIDGFTSYSQGHSQEFTIVNGKSSSRSIFSYVLMANAVGKKNIGPFEIEIGGKIYKVAAVQVEVAAAGSSSSTPSYVVTQGPVSSPPSRALPNKPMGDQDIFVKAWLDKDEVFVNEPVILTYTLYTRQSATYKGFEKEPVTTGFWVEDFPPEKAVKKTEQMFMGSRYVVADVRKLALFPTQAGVYSIDPGTLSVTVEVLSQDSFNSFSSSSVFGFRRSNFPPSFLSQIVAKTLLTDPITVAVKALPETGKPASFDGAVGHYEIESSVDKKEVEAGNPVTFRVRVAGQGNINTVQTPTLSPIDNFKIYDSSSSTQLSKERLVVEGHKVTETVIVPKKPGSFNIPSLSFSYFDPKTQAYREIKTAPQALTVRAALEEDPPSTDTGIVPVTQESVSVVANDIRYIRSQDDPRRLPTQWLYRRPIYWLINGMLLVIWAILVVLGFLKQNEFRDSKGHRSRRSLGLARQKLKSAKHLLKEEKSGEFYAEISKTMYAYFGDKLGIASQAVSLEAIEERAGEDLTGELLNDIRKLLNELAAARFSRSQKTKDEMHEIYDLSGKIIGAFEKVKMK